MKSRVIYIMCILICTGFMSCTVNKNITRESSGIHDNQQLCGGYTSFRSLTEEERGLFNETYKDTPVLEPFEVATQVVAGTNYRFRCRSREKEIYLVIIYQPLPGQGEAIVTSITKEK